MSAQTLIDFRARLNAGSPVFTAWMGTRDPAMLEALLREGYDCAVLDWQHGYHDEQSIREGILAAYAFGKPAIVRIGVGDFAGAARMLDWGAIGIVAPMINSVSDAKTFVDFVKYPPLGGRSWGPPRALNFLNMTMPEHLKRANDVTLAIAMIETREAYDALDDILAVPGLDGVLVGPSDLSIALTNGASVDQNHPLVDAALTDIAARTRKHGKIACAFTSDGKRGAELGARGFHLMSIGTDQSMLRNWGKMQLAEARKSGSTTGNSGY